MRKQLIISLLTLSAVGIAGSAWAQEWSFGPKINLGLSKRFIPTEPVKIGPTLLAATKQGDGIGSSIGFFTRYDRLRWYAQAEGNHGRYYLTSASINGLGGFIPRTDVRLIGGFKPLPWLRLNAGVTEVFSYPKRVNYLGRYDNLQAFIQQQIERDPSIGTSIKERNASELEGYLLSNALQNSYKKTNLEGQIGIGADVGGLTLDLTYAQNLTPVVDGISYQNQTYAFKQNYGYWALGLGYKLFPLKRHLLAPRKNRAYERIKQDIPFYRNEFHVAAGLLAEDIGTQSVYENRYTRYLTRRLGIVGGLTYSRNFPTNDDSYSRVTFASRFTVLTGIRLLPLYSRRHTIGLAIGPQLTYTDALQGGFSRQSISGKPISYLNLYQNSAINELRMGWHGSVDYNFALTDRLLVGSWLRVLGNRFLTADYGNFGVQAGYRF